ncbi:hypothetical protein Pcinc_038256 [Petrolisthes cinctipes]|uniref:Uncharacterized protein n=1 Tax=Petrolisthes cinctipes TaxID=88211 RepID=A0AAE1BSD4_PETCI|nr:hypothetical protein Pcinc_038256 [Petrolisthes cinctipes]
MIQKGQTGGLSVHKYLKCGGSGSGKARDTTTTSYYARLRIMWLRPAAKSRLTTPDYSQVTGSLTSEHWLTSPPFVLLAPCIILKLAPPLPLLFTQPPLTPLPGTYRL